MKILLVAPAFQYNQKPQGLLSMSDFPAGVGYVAAALKQAGHTVVGLNPNNQTGFSSAYYMLVQRLEETLRVEKPDLIGLCGICTDYPFLKDAVELCRRFAPETPIVLGGGIISNDREFVFDLLHTDYGLVGEAEETVVQLAASVERKTGLSTVPNLSYWRDGKAVHNVVDHKYASLESRPIPDYSPFGVDDMLDNYSMATRLLYRYSRADARPFTIVTARGCPFNCSFCTHRGGPKYRARSVPDVMEEIRQTYDRYHFNILLILDELFAVNKERMREFCEGILDGKARYGWDFDWSFQTHASAAFDLDTLKLAKRAGCTFFSYGLESASPTVLDSMNKRTKPEQIIEAIALAHEAGVGFSGNLIFGDMAETQLTCYESLDFFARYCTAAEVFLAFVTPYPGSDLFDECVRQGRITDKAEYYANIENGMWNMTKMSDPVWYQWVTFIQMMERSWLLIKQTDATSVEREDTVNPVTEYRKVTVCRIEADCPYCGGHVVYREQVGRLPEDWPVFLGTSCQHCHKRIKVNLKRSALAEPPQREAVGACRN